MKNYHGNSKKTIRAFAAFTAAVCLCAATGNALMMSSGSRFAISALTADAADTKSDITTMISDFATGDVKCESKHNGETNDVSLQAENKTNLVKLLSDLDWVNAKTDKFDIKDGAACVIFSVNGNQLEFYEGDYCDFHNGKTNADTFYYVKGIYDAVCDAIDYNNSYAALAALKNEFISSEIECAITENGKTEKNNLTDEQKNDVFTALLGSLSTSDFKNAEDFKHDEKAGKIILSIKGDQLEIYEEDYVNFFDGNANADTQYKVNGVYKAVYAAVKGENNADVTSMIADFITGEVECTVKQNGTSEKVVIPTEKKTVILKALSAYDWKNAETTEYKHDEKAGEIIFSVNGNEFTICEEDCCDFFDGKLNADKQYKVKGIYNAVNSVIRDLLGGKGDVSDVSLGDLDGDGVIDASDASTVLAAYAAVQSGGDSGLDAAQTSAADVDGNGVVDASDASTILAYYAFVQTGSKDTSFEDFLKM